ncbi:MAG: glutamine amidotransferase subunit PdxT [Spirochaeta sp. LUC14_002_19_P3]|nr:MAG: glutamine amidotransferase subunit PdxT [Spirochaeta sp. LUC14_002_19_P3]
MSKTIGVLALQGAYSKHREMLAACGAQTVEVRAPQDLSGIGALVLPGGESTTMSRLLLRWELIEPIQNLTAQGMPIFGTCAGLILLADRLAEWNALPRIGGLDLTAVRNAYGRQIESFEAGLEINIPEAAEFAEHAFNGIFIRAPKILADSLGGNVEVLAVFEKNPVLVRQGNIIAAAFHPELSGDCRLHNWFVRGLQSGFFRGAR